MAEIKTMRTNVKQMSLVDVADKLCNELSSAELVCNKPEHNGHAILLCFEKYYFRSGNYASLCIMLTESPDYQQAVIVGFGGGSGIFNLSFGANEKFADAALDALQDCGFEEI